MSDLTMQSNGHAPPPLPAPEGLDMDALDRALAEQAQGLRDGLVLLEARRDQLLGEVDAINARAKRTTKALDALEGTTSAKPTPAKPKPKAKEYQPSTEVIERTFTILCGFDEPVSCTKMAKVDGAPASSAIM